MIFAYLLRTGSSEKGTIFPVFATLFINTRIDSSERLYYSLQQQKIIFEFDPGVPEKSAFNQTNKQTVQPYNISIDQFLQKRIIVEEKIGILLFYYYYGYVSGISVLPMITDLIDKFMFLLKNQAGNK